jgi:hypothetical protein
MMDASSYNAGIEAAQKVVLGPVHISFWTEKDYQLFRGMMLVLVGHLETLKVKS